MKVISALHSLYKLTVSRFLGERCRFYPPCSDYALEAFKLHGALRGSALTAKRLLRCHPCCAGGFDPVPRRNDCSASTQR